MYKEPPSTEAMKKPEAQENLEAPRSIESSEELQAKMTNEAEKETVQFEKECTDDLLRVETGAEKDGLSLDSEDKKELQGLNQEADLVRAELMNEIGKSTESPEKIQLKSCPNCGKENKAGNKFCEDCGNKFENKLKPPPLPEEYLRTIPPPLPTEYQNIPPHALNMPPPLPNIPPPISEQLRQDSHESDFEEKELESVDYYLQKSKIADKEEALQRFMEYVGVDSKEALKDKLKEKDENGDSVIEIDRFTPDDLKYLADLSGELLKKIRNVGDALGYTYMNTPGYKSQVEDLASKLRREGRKEEALEAKEIFEELERNFENDKDKSEFKKIDENLTALFQDEEKYKKYIEDQKRLPPDAIVHLYHGLNSGGYKAALEILNGSSHGIEQHSGPTLSLTPSGGFWKGVGFRYSLRRDQIEFPGENNPNAVVRMEGDDEDTGKIVNESGSLPLDKFEAEIMRSKFTLPNPDLEKKLVEKLHQFSEERNARKSA
jgi:hypothetical protein